MLKKNDLFPGVYITLKWLFCLVLWNETQCYSFNIENSTNLDNLHVCKRPCMQNEPSMVCIYSFKIEHYETLSKECVDCSTADCNRQNCIVADGYKRSITVVNRQLPGPTIEVCQRDEIIVDVHNLLVAESTTIHWHGHHQRPNPYMDGVPFVTQCPIHPGSSFRYSFEATKPGTYFWHSHIGMQRGDGVFGALIIRRPLEDDPYFDLYDFDAPMHTIILSHWLHQRSVEKFVGHHHSNDDNAPTGILINGKGKTADAEAERFIVEKNVRYRFRLINAGFLNCPLELSVDNHTLTVINSDGNDLHPVEVTSITTNPGERYDFIVNANQQPGLYWIKVKGYLNCDERFTSAFQVAVLQYEGMSCTEYPSGSPNYVTAHNEGMQLNGVNAGRGNLNSINIAELQSLDKMDLPLREAVDYKFIITYDFYKIDNIYFHKPGLYGFYDVPDAKARFLTPQLNHISLKLPPSPLLPDRFNIDSSTFCNRTTQPNCTETYCECLHVLQVPLNSSVEVILIDEGAERNSNHVFHLHGHWFRVVSMDRVATKVTEDIVMELDRNGTIQRNFVDPPLKDTVTVPDGGYTIIRFIADNPGFWLFHCHLEFHSHLGMALVFKIGENEEMVPVPPNFPQCGNYIPN